MKNVYVILHIPLRSMQATIEYV